MTYTIQKENALYKQCTEFTEEDTVITNLKLLAIAIRVLKRYPEALNEFKKESAVLHQPEEVINQNVLRASS